MNTSRSLTFHFCAVFLLAALRASGDSLAPTLPPVPVSNLIGEVVTHHPELRFYEAEIEAAKAGRKTAGSLENPVLTVEAGHKRVTSPAGTLVGEGTAWTVSLSQTFEWPGRLALRKAIANQDVSLAELGLERFKAGLSNRTRVLVVQLHGARQKAKATAEVAARYQALRELFLSRDPGGITPLLEARVMEAQDLALQHRATEAQLAAQAALTELNQLRGLPAGTPLEVEVLVPTYSEAPSLEAALARAREVNFEFRAAKLEWEQQGLVVSLARHEGRPAFTVSPYFTQEKAGDLERTAGVSLSVPLPFSKNSKPRVALAEARQRQAEAAIVNAQRVLERDVAEALQRYEAKRRERARWAPEAVEKFSEAADLADRHYRLGAVPLSTYIELQNVYLEAVEALVDTEQEILEAAAKVQLLCGSEILTTESKP